jgi:predicted dehydrogenase
MNVSRRGFIKQAGAVGAVLPNLGRAVLAQDEAKPSSSGKTLRVGFVGVGVKGSQHVGHLMRMEGVELRAVCDIVELQCRDPKEQAKRLGKRPPTAYARGERDFERMCAEEDLDLVYTATPWEVHVPVCLAAMKNGKHAATEIPAAYTLEECWQLVEASERTGLHLCMMENVNYMPDELVIYNMVRRGLLGELIHGEGGYLHDTRQLKMNDFGDGLWLGDHHATRNGNLYPCHGFGPLAWYMNINRGDCLDYLVSMSSKARGLDLYAAEHLPPGHPKRERKYINGDVNTCLIRTKNGVTITLTHNTDSPRPYSRINLVQGTRGIVSGWPQMAVSLEGDDPHPAWESGDKYRVEHASALRAHAKQVHAKLPGIGKDFGPILEGAVWHYAPDPDVRHGDFLEDLRLVEALRHGVAPDYDVYDAATWSSIAVLSERSVADRGRPVDVPDFTKGRWKQTPPIQLMGV